MVKVEKSKEATSVTTKPSGPTRRRKQKRRLNENHGGHQKNQVLPDKRQPSLTWLLPGAARAQRRPLPRPTKPPPPGITPLRRLGVWRRVREEGDTGTAVFVTLEGEVVRKPHSYHAAQRDEAILSAAGIRGRGRRSRISTPELLPSFAASSRLSSELQLQYWCLPPPLVRAYTSLGVESLYPWQAQCLRLALPQRGKKPPSTQEGDETPWRSLVYCAPTSGGKSLVAEVVIARRLLFEGVRSLVVVPHVSLCAERVQHLRQLLGPLTLRVEAFHAGANAASNWYAGIDVAICTLEKANLILNRLVQDLLLPEAEGSGKRSLVSKQSKEEESETSHPSDDEFLCRSSAWWDNLRCRLPSFSGEFPVGLVCVDEIHFIGDPQRGHLLEMLLAKLLFINQTLQLPVQLIGMSATLPNASQVARWLGAEVFVTDVRPSPLDVFVKVGPEVFSWSGGEGLRLARRLHDGRLCLPPTAEAATCAAARALAAAASASLAAAADPELAGTQQTASRVTAGGTHASLVAAALRFLRKGAGGIASVPSFERQGRKPAVEEETRAADEECRAGWQADGEHLGALTWEVLREGRRVVVFCPTQEWAARTASFLAKALPFYRRAEAWADLLRQRAAVCLQSQRHANVTVEQPKQQPQQHTSFCRQEQLKEQQQQQQRQALRQARKELLAMPVGLLAQLLMPSPHLYVEPQVLQGREGMQWQLKQISRLSPTTMLGAIGEGVAYHHAGLSGEERECVETGYRRGHLNVLCATSTLAMGVNLPAARVIIRAPYVGRDEFLSAARFHQMAGRAGRKGLESRGEAYLMCVPSMLPAVRSLLSGVSAADSFGSSPEGGSEGSVMSCLRGQRLCRFFLEAVHVLLPLLRAPLEGPASAGGPTFVDVATILLHCTLRSYQDSHLALIKEAAECARYLHSYYLLETEPAASLSSSRDPHAGESSCSGCSSSNLEDKETQKLQEGTEKAGTACGIEETTRTSAAAPATQRPSLRFLAFPSSPLPPPCRLLLQQYPCLRSPAVLTRMLQGGEFDEKPTEDLFRPMPPHASLGTGLEVLRVAPAGGASPSKSPLKSGGPLGQRACIAAAAAEERDVFASSLRLHFHGLDALACQLSEGHNYSHPAKDVAACSAEGNWKDVGGRLAATEAGAAAVEAGLAPWEAAELFADVFKTSVLGLCLATELHLIYLAAVSIGGINQPHWQSYLSVYDELDAASRRVADSLGIRRQVISNEGIKAQGVPRCSANETAELLLADRLTFSQLRARVEIETHRRFFFALLLHAIYREGEAYEVVMGRFGVAKNALIACTSQGALICSTVASFLRSLRPQEAALSEVCFMLAKKLKLAYLPIQALASTLAISTAYPCQTGQSSDDPEAAAALQQFLQLEGMTPRRAVALHAVQISTCAELANAPIYSIFKALEAAEPAPLTRPEFDAQKHQALWMYKIRRQHARLLAVAVKLKDAAQQEQTMRLQVLEDEAAAHWSLVEKVTEESDDGKEAGDGKDSASDFES